MTPTSTDGPSGPWPADAEARLVRLVHDLRTPLTIVTGFANLLERRDDLSPEQREEFLARMAQAARELGEILDSERADRHG
jgi:signal transduction histidine kinase